MAAEEGVGVVAVEGGHGGVEKRVMGQELSGAGLD